jgi:uncharacterized protein YdhG (YjbR/CyaY superfamily)
MAKTNFQSVDEYIAAQPEAARPHLERIRATIRKAAPKAEESISYQIAAYKLNGYPVLFFAGFKKHVGVYPITGAAAKEFAAEIKPYLASKATLRFPLDQPLPTRLIAAIAKFRAKDAPAPKAPKKTTPKRTAEVTVIRSRA